MAAVLLTGCSNSKLIIGPLYNRFDDQMRSEYIKLGDFNEAQDKEFEDAIGTFHVWHRQAEMPKYANLLQDIADSISASEATDLDDVTRWANTFEEYSRNVRECHPVNYSFDLVRSFTDEQISFIERRFTSERQKNKERYDEQTRAEHLDRRLKNIVKWAGRLGLDFTATQRNIIKDALTEQVSLRKEYYALSQKWNNYLFVLARNQTNPAYHAALEEHMTKLWTLVEDAHPEEWSSIRVLWLNTIYTLTGTLSKDQRAASSKWLKKMGKTVRSISEDTPSFKIGNDSTIGCLPAANL